nr:hypothetical protein [uncultured Rhodopila sp.]
MMSDRGRATGQSSPARGSLASVISLIVLTVVLGVVMFIALRSPLKDDIAWLLYVARRWMAGRELYVDVVEVNPPLIVWISAVPLEIARWLNVAPQFTAVPVFVAAVLGCAWWTAHLLRAEGGLFAARLPVFAVIGTSLLLLPAGDLGQREHLLVAAFLPYLAIFARSLDGKRSAVAATLAAGVLAGLGCALKPRYAGVFAVLECLALTRGLRPWRALPLAAGGTLLGYAALVAIVCPAYLGRAVPLALALYKATDVPFAKLLSDSALLIAGQAVVIALLVLRRRNLRDYSLVLTLVVFAAVSTVICFIDGKDWYYHRLPATVATALALVLWSADDLMQRRPALGRLPLAAACLAVAVFCASSIQRLKPEAIDAVEPQKTTVDRLEQIIRDEHARTYIAFSEWIALGFPVVNNTGVGWASRFDSMWALKGEIWRARFDPAADKEWPIARWVAHDFIAGCPDIAVVDTRETTKYITVLSKSDAAFARAWTRYKPIASFDGLVVYRRNRSGCMDVWVATEAKPAVKVR